MFKNCMFIFIIVFSLNSYGQIITDIEPVKKKAKKPVDKKNEKPVDKKAEKPVDKKAEKPVEIKKSKEKKETPKQGEGFVNNSGGVEGFVTQEDKVKKLIDDVGKGEEVPRRMVVFNMGLTGAEDIPLNPGVMVGGSFLFRPFKDMWFGAGGDIKFFTGSYDSVYDWTVNAQFRYYFMPHKEANRFVMGYFLVQAGYSSFYAKEQNVETTATGFSTAVGVGSGKALNTKLYLGFEFKYEIPFWNELCTDNNCGDKSGFNVSFWSFSTYISYSF
jgi:hypothetical protein